MVNHQKARHAVSNDAAYLSSNRQDHNESGERLRCDGWTRHKQRAFCESLSECGEIGIAAQEVGLSRQTAYRLRCRKQGQAFALAWDAAMLIAARVMVDQAVDLSLYGSIETVIRDKEDKDRVIKRKQTPAMLFATVERLRSAKILGTPEVIAASQDWDRCLDLLEEGLVYVAEEEDEPEILPGTGRWQPKADGGGGLGSVPPTTASQAAPGPSDPLRGPPPRSGEDQAAPTQAGDFTQEHESMQHQA
jgi:hypothetical protein